MTISKYTVKHLLCFLVASILILPIFSYCHAKGDRYRDSDWTTTFYNNCGFPSSHGETKNVKWIKEKNNRFLRFALFPNQQGRCRSDSRSRSRAPFWERAEIKQNNFLNPKNSYHIEFIVRIQKGFKSDRESFFQIHQTHRDCRASPLIMLKYINGKLSVSLLRIVVRGHNRYKVDHSVDQAINKWIKFSINVNFYKKNTLPGMPRTAEFNLSINGKKVIKNTQFGLSTCGKPYIKFGIYRPGRTDGNTSLSIIDFDRIRVRKKIK